MHLPALGDEVVLLRRGLAPHTAACTEGSLPPCCPDVQTLPPAQRCVVQGMAFCGGGVHHPALPLQAWLLVALAPPPPPPPSNPPTAASTSTAALRLAPAADDKVYRRVCVKQPGKTAVI